MSRCSHDDSGKKSEQGVALLMALFIMALIVGFSTALFVQMNRDVARTELWLRSSESELLAQGAVAWAQEQLRNNFEKQAPDRPVDVIPIRAPLANEQGFKIESVIYDLQSGFNLNELTDLSIQSRFLRLLQARFPKQSQMNFPLLIQDTAYWINPNETGDQARELFYQKRPNPYRVAHQAFLHYSEWRLVRGVTPEFMRDMKTDLTVLPEGSPINVQTASAGALMMLNSDLTLAQAEQLIALRKSKMWIKKEDFLTVPLLVKYPFADGQYTFVSQFFLLVTQISIGKQSMVFYTVLKRQMVNNVVRVDVMWQSEGAW